MQASATFLLAAVLLAVFLCSARPASALMPPHVRSTEPPHEGVLTGNVYTIHGYSLSFMDEDELAVKDAAGNAVPFTMEMEVEWEGEGDMPGARQERCTLWLTFGKLTPGATYSVEILGDVYTFTAAE